MKYRIVKSTDTDQLTRFVNDWLKDGYKLVGELKVVQDMHVKHAEVYFVQVMVKEDKW